MSTNHTPEPWRMIEDMPEWPQLSTLVEPRYVTMTFDDYRRAVACVNACAGINPEAVPDVVEALRELMEFEQDTRSSIYEWGQTMRDGKIMSEDDLWAEAKSSYDSARAALAKLEDVG